MLVFRIRQLSKELSNTPIFRSCGLPGIELECPLLQQNSNGNRGHFEMASSNASHRVIRENRSCPSGCQGLSQAVSGIHVSVSSNDWCGFSSASKCHITSSANARISPQCQGYGLLRGHRIEPIAVPVPPHCMSQRIQQVVRRHRDSPFRSPQLRPEHFHEQ